MKRIISLDQNTLKILYYKNKKFILPALVIIICVILFFKLIIPQIREVSLIKEQEKETKEKISVLKNNLTLILNLDNSSLDSQLQLTSSALPAEKDYAGIINAVSGTAVDSNVLLDDFSFEVGDLSTKSASLDIRPSIRINISIKGSLDNMKHFLSRLNEQFPLSEVGSVKIANNSANYATAFYFKSYLPVLQDVSRPINKMSEKEKQLLDKLFSWNDKNLKGANFLLPIQDSTSAADLSNQGDHSLNF